MGAMGLDSAKLTSLWLDSGSTWIGSRGGVFSRMWSSNASSAMVLWLNEPPAAISSCRVDSLLRPNQKCCNSTWFGIDKSRPECARSENMAQVSPMVSVSFCWKLRISCRREAIQDIGKTEYVPQFFPISFYLPYVMGVPLFCPLIKREGKQLPPKSFM